MISMHFFIFTHTHTVYEKPKQILQAKNKKKTKKNCDEPEMGKDMEKESKKWRKQSKSKIKIVYRIELKRKEIYNWTEVKLYERVK